MVKTGSAFVSDLANLNGNGDFYSQSHIDLDKTKFLFRIDPDPIDQQNLLIDSTKPFEAFRFS